MTYATRRTLKEFAADCGMALLFIASILLAGSDGPLFPWPNLGGVALFGLFARLTQRKSKP